MHFVRSEYSTPIVNERGDLGGAELGNNSTFTEGYDYSFINHSWFYFIANLQDMQRLTVKMMQVA